MGRWEGINDGWVEFPSERLVSNGTAAGDRKWFVWGCVAALAIVVVVIVAALGARLFNKADLPTVSPQEQDTVGFPDGKNFIDYAEPGEKFAFWDSEGRPSRRGRKSMTITRKPDEDGKDMVVKQLCDRDGRYYFVSASLPDKVQASRKLAEVRRRTEKLVHALARQTDGGRKVYSRDGVDLTGNIKKLLGVHKGRDTPLAEYHNPGDQTVGSNCDKGVLIEVCLREKRHPTRWNADNSIFRVHVHELAHSADYEIRGDGHEAHGPDFYRIQTFLLILAQELGVYSKAEYLESDGGFCGLRFSEKDDF
jgi:hypothetical protein